MSRLIGDIGGTNTRLALIGDGTRWERMQIYRNDDFGSLEEVVATYLRGNDAQPDVAAFAVAGPVRAGAATLTNRGGWKIAEAALAERFALEHCRVVNDFSAVALGVPALAARDVERHGGGDPDRDAPVAILGPGTGLGVGGLVPGAGGGRVLVTEGGHASVAASDERQDAIVATLRRRFGHVSAERVVSGQGLVNLYRAVAELDGGAAHDLDAAGIGAAARAGSDAPAAETLAQFFRFLGAIAGDLALAYGAFGGVYIAGGIVPRYLDEFGRSGFREAFESKGRMREYVRAIPVFVILHEEVELLGLAASLDARATSRPWPTV